MTKHIKTLSILFSIFITYNISAQNFDDVKLREEYKKSFEFGSWSGKSNIVRDGINLKTLELTSLETATKIFKEKDFFLYRLENGQNYIKHVSNWMIDVDDFLEITISYFNSGIDAQEYVIDQYFIGSTLPKNIKLNALDQMSVLGDVSFYGGRIFIKNNIVVDIHAEGQFESIMSKIAKEIDFLLSNQKTYNLPEKVKPRLEKDYNGNIRIVEP
jgi:hypothetical protein